MKCLSKRAERCLPHPDPRGRPHAVANRYSYTHSVSNRHTCPAGDGYADSSSAHADSYSDAGRPFYTYSDSCGYINAGTGTHDDAHSGPYSYADTAAWRPIRFVHLGFPGQRAPKCAGRRRTGH